MEVSFLGAPLVPTTKIIASWRSPYPWKPPYRALFLLGPSRKKGIQCMGLFYSLLDTSKSCWLVVLKGLGFAKLIILLMGQAPPPTLKTHPWILNANPQALNTTHISLIRRSQGNILVITAGIGSLRSK